jgi:NADP-reducing hydrogenase subunit HndD
MGLINIKINNMPVQVDDSVTVLEACKSIGIKIPTLCYLKDVNESGACRVCLVEIKGVKNLVTSCCYPIRDGLEVFTNTERVLAGRRNSVELIMSNHSKNCLSCIKSLNCELQELCQTVGVRENAFVGEMTKPHFDDVAPGIIIDTSKCVLCGRCIETCNKVQGLGILGFSNRGFDTVVGPVYGLSMDDVNCMQCGQCVNVCPTGALSEKESIHEVIQALNDPSKHVIVQTAPAVRASLGEEFGMPIGSRVTGKMVTALKAIGFNRVYDTNYGADLTIMEEGTEFIDRVSNSGVLPMITSCSPGWVRYLEFEYPELIPNLSSCKSPHMMFGALLKTYYPKAKAMDPRDIYVVSVMPCTAKKAEIAREEMVDNGVADVDAVITTRELGRLIKMYGLDFPTLKNSEFDHDMFGEYSGAGVIFGATGGVMEAALRTVTEILEGKSFDEVNYEVCRGKEGVKHAELDVAGIKVRIAIASGMVNAKPLLEEIKAGTSPYHFIEIMGCPGGCINGGGQSIIKADIRNGFTNIDWITERSKALYAEDESLPVRKSHENVQIQQLYENFLEKPGSHIAHDLLHTHYYKRNKMNYIAEEDEK